MKKSVFTVVIVLVYATSAFSGTATWTGKQIPVAESTGYTVKCEYAQGLIKFWRLTNGVCQPTVKANSGEIPKTGTTRIRR